MRSAFIVPAARIYWLSPEEGGRQSIPTVGRYSTAARFEAFINEWPREAWSVVLEISVPADMQRVMVADVRMLAGDSAPAGRLAPGSRFELFEGPRLVARAQVLKS